MAKENKGIKGLIGNLLSQTVMSWTLIAAAVAATVAVVLLLHHLNKGNSVEVVTNDKIDITPTQIEQIRSIGQWEFLSISDEELIDTVRHGFFSDDELVRIYYGTLRLGLDLSEARPDWIVSSGDSITMTLPRIKLLDKRFIDEGRTRSFFESGKLQTSAAAAWYNTGRRRRYGCEMRSARRAGKPHRRKPRANSNRPSSTMSIARWYRRCRSS